MAFLVAPVRASAEPLPIETTVTLHHAITVTLTAGASDTHVAARAGRAGEHTAEASVPTVLDDATVERIDATTGPVAVIRASGGGRAYAWLVVERAGAPAIAWSGRTDLHGDPGERVADTIELTDRTGDGRADVVVGQVRDGVTACGATALLLFPSALDASGGLRAVSIARVSGERVEVTATTTSPGPTPPPIGTTLRMLGETSALGLTDAASLSPPYALTDGNPATGWIEGRGGAGAGELVVARVDAARPVRAIALVRSTAAGVEPPRSVFVIGETGPALHVTLPETFDRAWIALPEPRAWSCLAIVIERGPSEDGAQHVGLGDLEAYTELDFGGGIASLIDTLVAEGSDAERTADWLARAGSPALDALLANWDRLSALGHRRAVRVAAAHASAERARQLLSRAAVDDDADVRTDALAALGRGGAAGASALVTLAAAEHGEDAATTLSMSREAFDIAPLLPALAGAGADRPHLRAAISARLAREPRDTADASVAAWLESASVSAIASLASGVSEARPELARDLVTRASGTATDFVDRYRLVLAATHATPSDANDVWLVEVATRAEQWMLRDAAVTALALRSAPAITTSLGDTNPRVRTTAVTLLASDAESTPRLVDRATRDPWPMVRVAALESLAHRDEEIRTLRDRLRDASPMVRERAIQLLAERGDRDAWPLLLPIFADDDEWPRVTAAALEFASTLCVADATDAIVHVMHRGTREGAWAPHVDVAVQALRVARRLGGEAAEQATAIATRSANEAFAPVLAGQGDLPACASAARASTTP